MSVAPLDRLHTVGESCAARSGGTEQYRHQAAAPRLAHCPGHRPDVSAMLVEVLLAILVVLVPFLVVVDVSRTPRERPGGQAGQIPSASADANRQQAAGIGATVTRPAWGQSDRIDQSASGHGGAAAAEPTAARKISRLALKNMGVRSRLFLLVSIPTVTAVALGVLRVASSVRSARLCPASSLRAGPPRRCSSTALVVLLVLAVALVSTVIVGRSMLQQLRKLRAGALEVADVQLASGSAPHQRDRRRGRIAGRGTRRCAFLGRDWRGRARL